MSIDAALYTVLLNNIRFYKILLFIYKKYMLNVSKNMLKELLTAIKKSYKIFLLI